MTRIPQLIVVTWCLAAAALHAELKLPAIVGDHMVLQQQLANPIWGWDTPGGKITVTFAGQTKSATAGADGKWMLKLDPVPANDKPQSIKISDGTQTVNVADVLVGEVWMCSGQSNMQFPLCSITPGGFGGDWNSDLEAAAAKLPNLRLIRVPNIGTQELQDHFQGAWQASTPETAASFSAVGFFFGRYLQQILNVPVGLIDNSWGGSGAEAWVRRTSLEKDPRFAALMERTVKDEAIKQSPQAQTRYTADLEKYQAAAATAKAAGKTLSRKPNSPAEWLTGNKRPGNIFNGVVNPTRGYGIKGVVWYQGESNTSQACEYAQLFSFLIDQWRKEWNQGDFPFYWVQLAGYKPQKSQPGESAWAELREAQTQALALPHTGQAVIIDLGEGNNIHPKNKHDVAARLARWALANDYGCKFPYRSPEFKSMESKANKLLVTFDCFGSRLRTIDVAEANGFAVCGPDRAWHWAHGKLLAPDRVELTCSNVTNPVAVRYAWADHPVCNLTSLDGLPVTPFRSDKPAPPHK